MDEPNNVATEATSDHTVDWYATHRTTAEERETAAWAEERTRSLEADSNLKRNLGQDFEGYKKHLDSLDLEEREKLAQQEADKVREALDKKAATDSELEALNEAQKKQREEDEEDSWTDSPEGKSIRKSMKKAYQSANALDEQIAELRILNELRDDPADPRWDELPADKWKLAREGNTESLEGEIQALLVERQTKLAETQLHQNAWHAGILAQQPREAPIGYISDENGQPLQMTKADIQMLVQAERDEMEHAQRLAQARDRYPDWGAAAEAAVRAGVDVPAQQAAFIKTLPNSADVAYYLVKNHHETRIIASMGNNDAARALMNISHKLGNAFSEPARKTAAPKPPSPVQSGSSRDFDLNDEGISADEWMRKRNDSLMRRGKA